MREKLREFLKILSVPLILFGFYLVVYVIWRAVGLPLGEELFSSIEQYFVKYGLWIVFVSAIVEGFFLLGQYFPGGTIIFLGVISAGGNISKAASVVFIVSVAFFISYTLNYVLGKYGWYKLLVKFGLRSSIENSKEKLEKQGASAVIFSYWEPNLASITATAAGILKIPVAKFELYSAMGIIFWNTFWGIVVFSLGTAALKLISFKYILIIFLIWIVILVVKKYFFDKKPDSNFVPPRRV